MFFPNRRKAFTLAEILVALVIIGIIAALTIPPLYQKITEEQFISALKKSFAEFSQARMNMTTDMGGKLEFNDDGGGKEHADNMRDAFCSYVSCSKKCSYNDNLGTCWHDANKWYDLSGNSMSFGKRSSVILSDGTLIFFENWSNNCSSTTDTVFKACGSITVDVNGFRPPNKIGRDIFRFWITANELLPMGAPGDTKSLNSYKCSTSSRGDECAAIVLKTNAMNY